MLKKKKKSFQNVPTNAAKEERGQSESATSGQKRWMSPGAHYLCAASLCLDSGKDRVMGKVDGDGRGKRSLSGQSIHPRAPLGSSHWLISFILSIAL